MRRNGVNKRDLAKLLRQTRQVKEELRAYQEFAQQAAVSLNAIIPDSEVEAMASPRADLLGTLEEMVNATLPDADRHLGNIEALLQRGAIDRAGEGALA